MCAKKPTCDDIAFFARTTNLVAAPHGFAYGPCHTYIIQVSSYNLKPSDNVILPQVHDVIIHCFIQYFLENSTNDFSSLPCSHVNFLHNVVAKLGRKRQLQAARAMFLLEQTDQSRDSVT